MGDHLGASSKKSAHLSLGRYCMQSWDKLLTFLPADDEQKDNEANQNVFVSRLNENYMGLYGLLPERDRFYAVVCDCGAVVKPQGLKNHLTRNHTGCAVGLRATKSDSSFYSSYGVISSSNNNGSSGSRSGSSKDNNNYSSSNSPASSTGSTPVKNPEDFSGILPNSTIVVKHKHKHKSDAKGKSKTKNSTLHHSSDSQPISSNNGDSKTSSNAIPEFVVNATSTSLDSGTYTFSNNKLSTVTPTKGNKKHRHKYEKNKPTASPSSKSDTYNPNRHCGVYRPEDGKHCIRSLSCKIHSLQQRKQVQGRSRSFESLLADLRSGRDTDSLSVEIESNSSSCSSVLEKGNVTDSIVDEATLLLKQQVEMPTIVLRKLEDEVVKGINPHAMAELLQNQTIVMKKEEPSVHETVVMDSSAVDQIKAIPPAELYELISQVEEQASSTIPDPNAVLTMEQLTTLVEENKQEMNMYVEEPQQIHTNVHCRTVAFPLPVFYLMKNAGVSSLSTFTDTITNGFMTANPLDQKSQEIKYENTFQPVDPFQTNQTSLQNQQYYDTNQVHSDFNCDLGMPGDTNIDSLKRPGQDILTNILTIQNIVPLVIDNYCDVFSKCDQSLLTDCSKLFPTLENIHEHENSDKLRYHDSNDYRSLKSCLYPNLPKPSYINTFGLKRIGGGVTLSRKSLYLRKTLLKTKDSEKKFKLKTDGSAYTSTNAQSPHGMLLTSASAVNKGRKRSFLANPLHAKQQRLESHTLTDITSVLDAGSPKMNTFSSGKLDLDTNLDELLQHKRQIFVPRY